MVLEYLSPKDSTTFYENLDNILCDLEFIKKKKFEVANVASVFDIEATSFYNSNNEKQSTMYAWVFGLNGRCIRGRTWGQFVGVIKHLKDYYNLSTKRRLIIYVHNLAYEFQWFQHYFEWENVFSLDTRKPLYALTVDGIEFRCSYLLSGYSLEVLGDNLTKYKVNKKVGDLDYSLMRHSQTFLTDKEWGYILNDGLVVMAHIQEEIERLGDITKLPLTKTGYVRNLCRERCLKGNNRFTYSKLMKMLTLTTATYKQLKRTYTGGFTHANIYYVDRVIRNVHSFDFSSSYPAVMLSEMYPCSKPELRTPKNKEELNHFLKHYCCMFDVEFVNIRATTKFENYISASRCTKLEHFVLNNGRVIEAENLKTSVTEQDYIIIYNMYEWDEMIITNFYTFFKDYLPKDLILTILDLYKDKTELKGVDEKIVEYLVSKGMINACYGMCVTDPCRDEIIYNNREWSSTPADVDTLIEKYNKDRNRFLYYAWGVWITAYARRNLFTGILEFKDDYIYSDTDSIKVINIEKHQAYIDKYNKNIKIKVENCLNYYEIDVKRACPKTIKGVSKQIGVWDYEGMYDKFKTLGAKRYMTETNGELSITIAGVNKKAGAEYLKYTYKTTDEIFNAFTEELYFPPHYDKDGIDCNGSGKLCHTYIDDSMIGDLIDYRGVKGHYNEASGVHMENTDYTLNLDVIFKKLLQGIKFDYIY